MWRSGPTSNASTRTRNSAVWAFGLILAGGIVGDGAAFGILGDAAPSATPRQHGALAMLGTRSAQQNVQAGAAPAANPSHQATVAKYCMGCHNERVKNPANAPLRLDTLDADTPEANVEPWEKVIRKLRTRAMPPLGAPRPEPATLEALVSHLESRLDRAAAAAPKPGRTPVRRLSRIEYTNAVRDVLSVEIDGESLLPADSVAFGFDNNEALLTLSSGLLDRYLSVARVVSRHAVGDASVPPQGVVYANRDVFQTERLGEEVPFAARGGIVARHTFAIDGEYTFKVGLRRNNEHHVNGLRNETDIEVRVDGRLVQTFSVGGRLPTGPSGPAPATAMSAYYAEADRGLEVRVPVTAGVHTISVAKIERPVAAEGLAPGVYPTSCVVAGPALCGPGFNPLDQPLAIDTLEVRGPFNATGSGDAASRRRVFVCRPSSAGQEEACARTILSGLARRMYRRPVNADDVAVLLEFYTEARRGGASFDSGIQSALERLLVSPDFLFRLELDPPQAAATVARLTDVELASRLSFFLWSSVPDDELLKLAERNELSTPAVVDRQVRRMLADPRAKTLVTNFAAQWLHLRNLKGASPDRYEFPDFDEALRNAFTRETELFLASQMLSDRGVPELLDADYTFVNERLARHYGIAGVYGSHFRRVSLTDPARRGLLGQGSILTVTSHANRTSPVIRGKWVLENLLGTPPPPPPPNVPSLPEGEDGQVLSMRARMEQHRRSPVCASCHQRMDPIGLALERFDAVGRLRNTDHGQAIDTSGMLPDGKQIAGVEDLRAALVADRREFVYTVTEKLFTYALGRGIEFRDAPALRQVVKAAAPEYRWSSLIAALARSATFQTRSIGS